MPMLKLYKPHADAPHEPFTASGVVLYPVHRVHGGTTITEIEVKDRMVERMLARGWSRTSHEAISLHFTKLDAAKVSEPEVVFHTGGMVESSETVVLQPAHSVARLPWVETPDGEVEFTMVVDDVLPEDMVRAREPDGTYRADDPATPEDEAWLDDEPTENEPSEDQAEDEPAEPVDLMTLAGPTRVVLDYAATLWLPESVEALLAAETTGDNRKGVKRGLKRRIAWLQR